MLTIDIYLLCKFIIDGKENALHVKPHNTLLWYYLLNGHWPLKRSFEQLGNHTVQNLRIIFN